jgi:peptide/nickel transport system permease protein
MIKANRSKIIIFAIFIFLLLLLGLSFFFEFGIKTSHEPARLIYDSNGKVLRPPFPSSLKHPLGTDKNGSDLLTKLMVGFKYTFLFSIVSTFFSMMTAIVCSFFILFFLKPLKPYFESFLAPFLYVPAFILFFFLAGGDEFIVATHGKYFLIFYQLLIIVLIGFPPLLSLLLKEFEQLFTKDYVVASRLLGASKFHLARKQLFPVFKERFFIVFIQQTIATIILLIHLGVFQIFIGDKGKGGIIGEDDKFLSASSEWGGMIGQSIFDMVHFPWILLYPAIAVIGLILLFNIMMKQLEKIYDR